MIAKLEAGGGAMAFDLADQGAGFRRRDVHATLSPAPGEPAMERCLGPPLPGLDQAGLLVPAIDQQSLTIGRMQPVTPPVSGHPGLQDQVRVGADRRQGIELNGPQTTDDGRQRHQLEVIAHQQAVGVGNPCPEAYPILGEPRRVRHGPTLRLADSCPPNKRLAA